MRVFDFICPEGHVTEQFLKQTVETLPCPKCGATAVRMQSSPRFKLEGISGAYPTAADKWAQMHEQAAQVEAKKRAKHGE